MQILFLILFFYFYQIFAASVLENICDAYKNVFNFTTTAFFDNQCFLIFRIIGNPYLNIKPMCDETMKNASATCQIIHFNGSTIIQDFLISKLNIKPNDRFFTGLSRDNCNSPWLWRNFDNTTSSFISSIISLPEENAECDQNVLGYNSGTLDPVSSEIFNATSFICECFSNSNSAIASVSPPTIIPSSTFIPLTTSTFLPTMSTISSITTTTSTAPIPITTSQTMSVTTMTVPPSIPPVKNSKGSIFNYFYQSLAFLYYLNVYFK